MRTTIPGAKLISPEEARTMIAPVLEAHLGGADLAIALDRELMLDDEYARSGVLVLPDGAVIHGDLVLDWKEAEYAGMAYRGVLALGALTIEGDLLAENLDGAPFLVACGALSVRQIIKAGAPLVVGGLLTARGIIFCHYNHGSFRAFGGIKARALILDDHAFDLAGAIEVDAVALGTEALVDVLVPELLWEEEDGIVLMDDVSGEIVARMKAGREVLRVG